MFQKGAKNIDKNLRKFRSTGGLNWSLNFVNIAAQIAPWLKLQLGIQRWLGARVQSSANSLYLNLGSLHLKKVFKLLKYICLNGSLIERQLLLQGGACSSPSKTVIFKLGLSLSSDEKCGRFRISGALEK
jgi:hypothetical protein